jgi:exodeoxyribonuclease VII small subunit
MVKETTYTEAFDELKSIVEEIERGDISIDRIAEKVKRAAFLIRICRKKLTSTEEDVSAILRELESEQS